MAPMEGLTDFTYRNAYEKTFGKGRITKYFTPFISPNKSENFLAREIRDIDRGHNKDTYTVAQVMTNEAKDFIWTAKMLYEKYGYSEINLNAGCPSGTVVSKDKGSGMLRDTEKLDRFLDEVFEDAFIRENIKVSVKTRIGVEDDDSFPQIMEVYNSYPLEELIVHPRVRTDYYRNELHLDAFRYAVDNSRNKLVLNGDIFTRKNFLEMKEIFPKVDTFMLGRGLIADPGLINVLTDDNPEAMVRDLNADKKLMKELHDLVYAARTAIMPGDTHAIHRMKEMWCYMEYVLMIAKKKSRQSRNPREWLITRLQLMCSSTRQCLLKERILYFQKNSKSVTGSIISDIVCLLFLLVTCHKGKHLSWQESAAKNSGFHCKCRNNGKFACKHFTKCIIGAVISRNS